MIGSLTLGGAEVVKTPTVNALPLKPRIVTDFAKHDTDDPAIWVNRAQPEKSLVLGTDKDVDGALLVYDLATVSEIFHK